MDLRSKYSRIFLKFDSSSLIGLCFSILSKFSILINFNEWRENRPERFSTLCNEDLIKATVTSFEVRSIGKEEVVFYKIDLFSYITEKEWSVTHRYSEFHDLYAFYKSFFSNVPDFPSKSIGKVSNFSELNKRRDQLNQFIIVKYK